MLAKFLEGMMTIYTDECIKNMPTWNHVNKDEVKHTMSLLVYFNVIHNIQIEPDEKFIFPAVVICSSI